MGLSADRLKQLDNNVGIMKDRGDSIDKIKEMIDEYKSLFDPSITKMIAPETSDYFNNAMKTQGGTLLPPEKSSTETDQEHQKNVEEWQKNNREQLSKATHAVANDVTGFLSRGTGAVVGKLGDLGVPKIKQWVSGEENPSGSEMMANPKTSITRPITQYGQEKLDNGNTALGLGAIALGSFDSPSDVMNLTSKGLNGVAKLTTKTPFIGNLIKNASENMANNIINKFPLLKSYPSHIENKIMEFATNPESKYSDIQKVAEGISKKEGLKTEDVANSLLETKKSFLVTHNSNVEKYGKELASQMNKRTKMVIKYNLLPISTTVSKIIDRSNQYQPELPVDNVDQTP